MGVMPALKMRCLCRYLYTAHRWPVKAVGRMVMIPEVLNAGAVAGEWIAEEVSIAYGGVAPKTIMAPKVMAALKGQPWTGETLKKALEAVAEDVNITPNAPGKPHCFLV